MGNGNGDTPCAGEDAVKSSRAITTARLGMGLLASGGKSPWAGYFHPYLAAFCEISPLGVFCVERYA